MYLFFHINRANHSEIPEEEFTVRGLTEGKEYEFRICAVNAAGPGAYSETSEAVQARSPPGMHLIFLIFFFYLY